MGVFALSSATLKYIEPHLQAGWDGETRGREGREPSLHHQHHGAVEVQRYCALHPCAAAAGVHPWWPVCGVHWNMIIAADL